MPLPSIREIIVTNSELCEDGGFTLSYTFLDSTPPSGKSIFVDLLCDKLSLSKKHFREILLERYRKPQPLLIKLPTFEIPVSFLRSLFQSTKLPHVSPSDSDEQLVENMKKLVALELDTSQVPKLVLQTFEPYESSLPDEKYFEMEEVFVRLDGELEKAIVTEKIDKTTYKVLTERKKEHGYVHFATMRSCYKPKKGETYLEVWF